MDPVRFGRALGIGARSAAKAVVGAVDAAAAPNPGGTRSPVHPHPVTQSRLDRSSAGTTSENASRVATQARQTREGLARGGKRFGESAWGPFARLSGILWLEITGTFFGIFACFAATAVWAHRADLYPSSANHAGRLHVFVFLAMMLAFAYFCISSFVRAHRK